MSKYTITIKSLIDNHFDFQLTDYPIFDEAYRDTLNQNILNHYYMNEIGFETAPLFRFYLKQKLNEIMPYYNVLYEKQKELLDNLGGNVDLKETMERLREVFHPMNMSVGFFQKHNRFFVFLRMTVVLF